MAAELSTYEEAIEHGDAASDGGSGAVAAEVEVLPLEVLERKLTSHAAHLAAAEAEWLGWLGDYCVREGWAEWGCAGPVQWLSWQCGMSPAAGRERVRVAMALRDLPMISKRFRQGRLSYSKVRALTRVATPITDSELAQLGLAATGAQLDVIVRSYKNACDANKAAKDAWLSRGLSIRPDGDESTVFRLRTQNHHADIIATAINNEVNRTIDDGAVQPLRASARTHCRATVVL